MPTCGDKCETCTSINEGQACAESCPYDVCRPYQSNGDPADPVACPAGCADKCGFTEKEYEMCTTCANMTEFCSSSDTCDMCFLRSPAPGDKQSCAEVDPSIRTRCEEECVEYKDCARCCLPTPACQPEICDAIRHRECEDECDYDDCRPYKSDGSGATGKCSKSCAEKCSFTETAYALCELCEAMPQKCKSPVECDFCFLTYPAPGDKQSCDEVDDGGDSSTSAECMVECADYAKCTRGCVPFDPPLPPPQSPPATPPNAPPDAPPDAPEGALEDKDGMLARLYAAVLGDLGAQSRGEKGAATSGSAAEQSSVLRSFIAPAITGLAAGMAMGVILMLLRLARYFSSALKRRETEKLLHTGAVKSDVEESAAALDPTVAEWLGRDDVRLPEIGPGLVRLGIRGMADQIGRASCRERV